MVNFLSIVVGIWLLVVFFASFSEARKKRLNNNSPKRPHVVFVLADDFGYNDVGYHARNHGSQMYTPFLDSLAEKGVKLENYYVQPICSPTRGQLLSGRYQIHTGMVHGVIKATQAYGFPLGNILLPEQLRNCGYKTHMIGKWHLGFYRNEYLPWNRGFNTFYGYLTGAENYYTKYKCEPKKTRQYCGVDFIDSKTGATNKTWGQYSSKLFLKKAKEIIQKHKKNKLRNNRAISGGFESRRVYGGMVLAMDKMLKQFVQYLKKAKMWKDTIFVFSTDNGGQTKRGGNNWPLRGNKGTLWEGGIKGVGFVHGKPLKLSTTNAVNHQLIHVSDWFPTIMSATGCSIMPGTQRLDGFDQWETIRLNTQSKRTEILHNIDPLFKRHIPPKKRNGFDISIRSAIRSGKWKLLTGKPDQGLDDWVRPPECSYCYNETIRQTEEQIRAQTAAKKVKLYNVVEDPYERNEVSDKYPEIVDLLLSRLVQYNASAAPALYPLNNRKADPKLHGGFWLPWDNKKTKPLKLRKAQLASLRRYRAHKRRRYKFAMWKRNYYKPRKQVHLLI